MRYFRQALALMREEKLYSAMYIAGTALAVAFVMLIAEVYYVKVADIAPEVHRSTTYRLPHFAYQKQTGNTVGIDYQMFRDLFQTMKAPECVMAVDETYLLPVRITSSNMKIMDSSAIAYYVVRRSSAITVAASLHDNWINFPLLDVPGSPQANAYNGLTAVTYEALIWLDQFDLTNSFGGCNISSVMGVEQYLLMRIGDVNFERQQIQFDGSGGGSSFGKFPASDATKKLYEGQWYHVACTYDQATRTVRVYVNGKIQSEGNELGISVQGDDNKINLAQRALGSAEAYQFFIAKSYNDFRPLQGKIAEARVWSVARTPEEIWENMYRIKNPKDLPELIGYWKFDEGKGNTVKDYSMYGNDGVAEKDILWPSGIEIPEINKEEE